MGLHPLTAATHRENEVKSVHDLGVEICMVIGGGNNLSTAARVCPGMR